MTRKAIIPGMRTRRIVPLTAAVLLALGSASQSADAVGRRGAVQARPVGAPRPVGSMSELMVDILYPASDGVFYISTRTPKSDVEWTELQGKTLMLAESANLLMMPGRARDNDRWMSDSKLLLDAASKGFAAAKKKDVDALVDLNEALYQSCVQCHMHYRVNYGRR
jgi:hypothetical protein